MVSVSCSIRTGRLRFMMVARSHCFVVDDDNAPMREVPARVEAESGEDVNDE